MMKLDHLAIPVADVDRSRRWYVGTLGLTVEFEVPGRDVDATFADWSARGTEFAHAPRRSMREQ